MYTSLDCFVFSFAPLVSPLTTQTLNREFRNTFANVWPIIASRYIPQTYINYISELKIMVPFYSGYTAALDNKILDCRKQYENSQQSNYTTFTAKEAKGKGICFVFFIIFVVVVVIIIFLSPTLFMSRHYCQLFLDALSQRRCHRQSLCRKYSNSQSPLRMNRQRKATEKKMNKEKKEPLSFPICIQTCICTEKFFCYYVILQVLFGSYGAHNAFLWQSARLLAQFEQVNMPPLVEASSMALWL